MADLSEFYPAPAQASPNGSGRPAAPGAVASPARAGGAAMAGAPAVWVLAIAAVSLILLHKAG